MRPRILSLLLVVSLAASTASAGSIGLFFDPDAASCSGPIANGSTGRIYIIALLSDVADVMTVAEFRVDGLPAGWVANLVPNPASNIVLGNPFDGVGCDIAFPTCQADDNVLLFTVDLLASTAVSDHYLRVRHRNPPPNPNFPCPLVTECIAPIYDKVCVSGGEAIINPTGPGCTVAVEATSWSRVKSLYE